MKFFLCTLLVSMLISVSLLEYTFRKKMSDSRYTFKEVRSNKPLSELKMKSSSTSRYFTNGVNMTRMRRFSKDDTILSKMKNYLEEVQSPRIRKTFEYCRKPSLQKTHLPKYHLIMVDNVNHLVYCDNRKAASSSILAYMSAITGLDTRKMNLEQMHFYLRLNHFKSWNGTLHQQLAKSVLFTVVRHPFRRFVSCYTDKITSLTYNPIDAKEAVEQMLSFRNMTTVEIVKTFLPMYTHETKIKGNVSRDGGHFIIRKAPKLQLSLKTRKSNPYDVQSSVPKFREFLLHAVVKILLCAETENCPHFIDYHIIPMAKFCNPCFFPMDFIMKVETLNEDMQNFVDLLGLPSLGVQKPMKPNSSKEIHREKKPKRNPYERDKPGSRGRELQVINKSRKTRGFPRYEDYMSEISDLELDLLFTAYYEDFQAFDYDPSE